MKTGESAASVDPVWWTTTHRHTGRQTSAVLTRESLQQMVEEVLRESRRLGLRQVAGRRLMTIQRAKNREFRHVLVLWPHSATGTAEHPRRLLYNAVTRAQDHCTIVVFGQGRTHKPPFAGS